jgi:hypothetical protein
LTERARRIWAATEARATGRGGITVVARATGIAHSTIRRGLKELTSPREVAPPRIRRPGGGRKKTLAKDPTLLTDLQGLVEPTASGHPQSPLRWTSKSVRHLAEALQAMGHAVSRQLVAELLAAAGYSLQGNRKTREGSSHPDRDAQFRYINQQVRRFQGATQPVISVDTKKKELVGDFKNAGRQWRPTGQPEPVLRQNCMRHQVIDLPALIRRQSPVDDHPSAPPASTPPGPLRRPPPGRPGEPCVAPPARRLQKNGEPTEIAQQRSALLGRAVPGVGRLETG